MSIYLGFAVGALNVYLFNRFFSQEEYGLTQLFIQVFTTFSAFASLGTLITFYRFSPIFSHHLDRKKNDLPFLIMAACAIGLSIVVAIMFGFKDQIVRKFSENSPLFVEKYFYVFPLTISFLIYNLFESYAFMLKRTVQFNLTKELGFRLFQTTIILLYAGGVIELETFYVLFSLMFVPSLLIMSWIVFANEGIRINLKISKLTKRIYKIIAGYTSFHFSGTLLSVLPTAINSLLIGSISKNGLSDVAVYIMARFFISVLDAPLRGMYGVNVATLSEAFHKRDTAKVGRIYKKASINLLVIGIPIFILIFTNIDVVSHLFKDKDYSALPQLFLIFGIAKLFELSMGMNNSILNLSKFWKIEFYISSFIILFSLPVNYFLIKQSPLLGAALGEGLMLILFCSFRYFFVGKLLHIKPYTKKTLGLVLIGIVCLFMLLLIPTLNNPYLNIILKLIVFLPVYTFAIWWYKPSGEVAELMEKGIRELRKRL